MKNLFVNVRFCLCSPRYSRLGIGSTQIQRLREIFSGLFVLGDVFLSHDLNELCVLKTTSAWKIRLAGLHVSTTAREARAASMVTGGDVLPARGAALLAVHLLHVSALVFGTRLQLLTVLHVSTTVGKARAAAMITGTHLVEARWTVLLAGHLLELLAHARLFSSSASAARLVRRLPGGVLVVTLPRSLAPPTGLVLGTVVTVFIFPPERKILATLNRDGEGS